MLIAVANYFTLYPNPVKDKAIINIMSIKHQKLGITVYDMSGKVILLSEKELFQGQNQLNLNTGQWSKGVYLISIRFEQEQQSISFIKQ